MHAGPGCPRQPVAASRPQPVRPPGRTDRGRPTDTTAIASDDSSPSSAVDPLPGQRECRARVSTPSVRVRTRLRCRTARPFPSTDAMQGIPHRASAPVPKVCTGYTVSIVLPNYLFMARKNARSSTTRLPSGEAPRVAPSGSRAGCVPRGPAGRPTAPLPVRRGTSPSASRSSHVRVPARAPRAGPT